MRRWLLGAPAWIGGVLAGLVFTGLTAAVDVVQGELDLSGVVLSGAIYTATMTLFFSLSARRRFAAAGLDDPRRRLDASRAAWSGPPPDDPDARADAARLLEVWRRRNLRSLWWALPVLLAFLAGSLWFAVTDSPWWWLNVLVFAFVLAAGVAEQRRAAARLHLLRRGPAGA